MADQLPATVGQQQPAQQAVVNGGLEHKVRRQFGHFLQDQLVQRPAPAHVQMHLQALGPQRRSQFLQPCRAPLDQGGPSPALHGRIEQMAGFQGGVVFDQQQVQLRAGLACQPDCPIECRLGRLLGIDDNQ
ncbi:hypothetical protein D3C80_1565380 [compost metagenome]